ncbi:Arginyl-tRNA--protein transferase 1 [Ceratobasidium sp. 394]|nr:Arginyl-tRNA--protein transferase 1 [Ceratobasidium sp. 394]KAG9090876.1 Arginyl-tRNA--protein transferase 1 [Ceratobasidium sp. UAMH 11750]
MSPQSEPITIVEIYGNQRSTCGYCTKKGDSNRPRTSLTVSMSPLQMSCSIYKRLLDRGWRRSGDYLYKPNLKDSCCPQYTIKLDAMDFKLSKNQRKALNKWNKFLTYGDQEKANTTATKAPPPLVDLVHAADASVLEAKGVTPAHRFEVTLEPSSFTDEKYQLFVQYQESIHDDTGNSPSGFTRFLVESAIRLEPIEYKNPPAEPSPYPLPTHYGSYHQMYRVDGELVAIGVIDILPGCVSSVYFMYAEGWGNWSLGKISAIREATLAKELHDAGAEIVDSLYMGFYIHSCPKMKYKGEYDPSYLLDPESYTWHPLKNWIPLLNEHKYATLNEAKVDQDKLSHEDMKRMQAVADISGGTVKVVPLSTLPFWGNPYARKQVEETIATFGKGLKDDIIISS